MATIRLNIGGAPGTVPAEAFLAALKYELAILRDLDVAISGNPKGTLTWLIEDLRIGSTICDMKSSSYLSTVDNGPEVSSAIIEAINAVEVENRTPPYLSAKGMKNVKLLVSVPRHFKLQGQLSLIDTSNDLAVTVTDAATDHLAELLPIKHRSIGTVEGRLDAINVHGKAKFTLYESRTRRAVACYFNYENWFDTVKDSLRQKVVVSGDLLANVRGETLRVDVSGISPAPITSKKLSIRDLDGIDPDFTGGLKSEEYVRRLRSA